MLNKLSAEVVNGQEISVEDLMRLYEQYQQERSNPFGR